MSAAPLEPPKKDFFVSYTRADRDWAEWITWYLEQAGYTCVLQKWDFRPGGNFVLDMQAAALDTQRTIAILSPDYLTSLYPQAEWAAAFVKDPTGKDRKLIPIRVRDCEPDGLLASIGYIDLVGREDPQKVRDTMLQGLQLKRAKPSSPPPFPGSATSVSTPPPLPINNTPASSLMEVLIVSAEEDEPYRKALGKHLRPLELAEKIKTWHRENLDPGDPFQEGINKHFYQAKLILLLVSTDFLYSPDCQVLMEKALERAKTGEIRVIPIIIRPCDLEDSPFRNLITIPRKGKPPISQWSNKDAAYLDVVKEIRGVLLKS
jgi:hypothetical protein